MEQENSPNTTDQTQLQQTQQANNVAPDVDTPTDQPTPKKSRFSFLKRNKEQNTNRWGGVKSTLFIVSSIIIIIAVGFFSLKLVYPEINFRQMFGLKFNNTTKPDDTQQPPKTYTPPSDLEKEKDYINTKYEFSLHYPTEFFFVQPANQDDTIKTFEFLYPGTQQEEYIENEENLVDGFIFRLNLHENILNQDIYKIALEKRNSYIIKCPDSAEISPIKETTLSENPATMFTVDKCDTNYVQTFSVRNNNLFEINQIYRGDVGIRQKYLNDTNKLREEFKFLNTIVPQPLETWTQYDNALLSFKYPTELDPLCCTLKGPLSETAKKMVVFADPKTIVSNKENQFNGFGIFTDEITEGSDFGGYVENQKGLLAENYRIVIGREPVTQQTNLVIAGQSAVKLSGYAWWGDVYIIETPQKSSRTTNRNKKGEVVIIVRTEIIPNTFDSILEDIFSTMTFGTN